MADWFEQLFGFREGDFHWTQSQFALRDGVLSSRHNEQKYVAGQFSTPTISELRDRYRVRTLQPCRT